MKPALGQRRRHDCAQVVAQDYYELPDQEHGCPRGTSPAVGPDGPPL